MKQPLNDNSVRNSCRMGACILVAMICISLALQIAIVISARDGTPGANLRMLGVVLVAPWVLVMTVGYFFVMLRADFSKKTKLLLDSVVISTASLQLILFLLG